MGDVNVLKRMLPNVHPLFRVEGNKIIWMGVVQKESRKNVMQTRILVISTTGLILLEKRTFPMKLVLSRIIPFHDLIQIRNDGEKMLFNSSSVNMVLQHTDHIHITSLVVQAYSELFPDIDHPPKISIIPQMPEQADTFIFEPESLLADRFLSLCSTIPSDNFVPEQISDQYHKLKQCNDKVTIDESIVASSIIGPLCEAIAYDKNVDSLHLSNLDIWTLVKNNTLSKIIHGNDSIVEVIFTAVSFQDCLSEEIKTLFQNGLFSPSIWRFDSCPLNTTGFFAFFSSLDKLRNYVSTLSFKNSIFNSGSFSLVFKTLDSHPFSHVEEISFSSIKEPYCLQNCLSTLLLSDPYLKRLELNSCNLDLSLILNSATAPLSRQKARSNSMRSNPHDSLLSSDSKNKSIPKLPEITKITCVLPPKRNSSHNIFENINKHTETPLAESPLVQTVKEKTLVFAIFPKNILTTTVNLKDFQQIGELDLSECTFTAESIHSLFHSLSHATRSPSSLILNSLNLPEADWSEFYKDLPQIFLPALSAFSFCGNIMDLNQVQQFATFIHRQPVLTDLSISGIVQPSPNATQSISEIASVLKNREFGRLVIRGDYDTGKVKCRPLRESLIPLLSAMVEGEGVKMLDISQQQIGNEGLKLIIKLASKNLQKLLFDGNFDGNDAETFIQNLDELSKQTQLQDAPWPKSDADFLQSKIPYKKRTSCSKVLLGIHKAFRRKLDNDDDSNMKELPMAVTQQSIRVLGPEALQEDDANQIGFVEDHLKAILTEVFDNENYPEPIVHLFNLISDSTLIENLI